MRLLKMIIYPYLALLALLGFSAMRHHSDPGYRYQQRVERDRRKAIRKKEADIREERTGMRQSTGAMITKITIGVLFVLTGFTTEDASQIVTGLAVGGGLIAWGVLPYVNAKQRRQSPQQQRYDWQVDDILNSPPLREMPVDDVNSAAGKYEANRSYEEKKRQLQQYKNMLDSGLITPQDYEKLKNQILGIR